jgi:hypothetical protein
MLQIKEMHFVFKPFVEEYRVLQKEIKRKPIETFL